MSKVRRKKTSPADFRLKGYYYAAQTSGLVVTLSLGVFIAFFPRYFLFLARPDLIALLLFAISTTNLFCFILRELTGRKFFWNLNRWLWMFFFLTFVYITGAVTSRYLFLLVFPLLVSAVDLEAAATKRVGIVLTLGFTAMLFADPRYYHTPVIITEHLIRAGVFGIIAYYVHKIVRETLHQKYEKEETRRQLLSVLEADKVKRDFLTVAQHQLRTPLSGIKWSIENILTDGKISGHSRAALEESGKKAGEAIEIINEMLKTAEANVPNFKPALGDIPLARFLESIISELGYLAKAKRASVSLHAPDTGLSIKGDPKLLRAGILNIIDNAIRYSPGGTVEISAELSGDFIKISVADTGIGIHADELPYVFERLYRGKNAIAVDPNESGVGLYMTKKIVELHGGTVKLQSVLGKGTTVTITLPAA